MDEHTQQLFKYIQQQFQSGQTADQIYQQLQAVGWPEATIQQAFAQLQAAVVPSTVSATPVTSEPNPSVAPSGAQQSIPMASGQRHGRIRTGWQLFKQSMTLLKGNKYLLRYLLMTGLWVFAVTAVFVVMYVVFNRQTYSGSDRNGLQPLGYVFAFFDYLFVYFTINLYAAGLTANVLDIFHGTKKDYRTYMHVAWSKAPAILIFSLISATVGMLLQYVVERIRFVGWILAWLLGTAWSLSTLFVIPIIVAEDKPSGVKSIKKSMAFFKQNWGEGVTTKLTVNAALFFVQIALLFICFFLIIGLGAVLSYVGVIIGFFISIILLVSLSIVGSFANSVINIALYYFATTHTVPPAFNEELLNKVFSKRQRRGLFGRKQADTPA